MSSVIVFLLFAIIGYTLADVFGSSSFAFKDIRYWIIVLCMAGIHAIDLNVQEGNMPKKRTEYFEIMIGGIILDMYETKEFTDITCKRGGDVITYRIYGNEAMGYTVTER